MLARFGILAFTTNEFLQSLFWFILWNINLKRKLGFFYQIIQISSFLGHTFDILNQLILDLIVAFLSDFMSILNCLNLVNSGALNFADRSCFGLSRSRDVFQGLYWLLGCFFFEDILCLNLGDGNDGTFELVNFGSNLLYFFFFGLLILFFKFVKASFNFFDDNLRFGSGLIRLSSLEIYRLQ